MTWRVWSDMIREVVTMCDDGVPKDGELECLDVNLRYWAAWENDGRGREGDGLERGRSYIPPTFRLRLQIRPLLINQPQSPLHSLQQPSPRPVQHLLPSTPLPSSLAPAGPCVTSPGSSLAIAGPFYTSHGRHFSCGCWMTPVLIWASSDTAPPIASLSRRS